MKHKIQFQQKYPRYQAEKPDALRFIPEPLYLLILNFIIIIVFYVITDFHIVFFTQVMLDFPGNPTE
ncbi:hypothetical protein [Anaerotignum neopropionicum]|uniref:hypothetical protein n=1 Tax=Anaerotignum neopropionicum TaxID=36847 RepID=UPI0008244CDD|nr:hypothetical protein [Anaerotignum neopropionicum]